MMKKLLIFIFLAGMYFVGFSQDSPPETPPAVRLQTPNNPTFWYNPQDSMVWIYKGSYGWTKLASDTLLKKKYVPYIGANKNVDLDTFSLETNSIKFENNPTLINLEYGELFWDLENYTLAFMIPDGGIIQIGQEPHDYYHNLEGAAIVDGDIVSTCGASDNRTAVCLTDASDDEKALAVFGMVTVESIGNNTVGRVAKSGSKVRNLNTSVYSEGTVLWVDPLNKGKWTDIMPSAPYRAIKIGVVAVSHSQNGVVELQIQILPKVTELADVDGTPLTENGQIMVWSQDSGYFDFNYTIWDDLISNEEYSSTWLLKDSTAPTMQSVYKKISTMEAVEYCPIGAVVDRGTTISGSYADLCEKDNVNLVVQELSGSDPLRITFTFSQVERFNQFVFFGQYNGGASHELYAEIYDPVNLTWDYLGTFGLDMNAQWHSFPVYQSGNYIALDSTVQVRIRHFTNGIPSHEILIDYVNINYLGSAGSPPLSHNQLGGLQGGSIALNQFYHLTLDQKNKLDSLENGGGSISENFYFEKETEESETDIDVGFILNEAIVYVNGDIIPIEYWSGTGTSVINFSFPLREFDQLIVTQSYNLPNNFYFEKELANNEININVGFELDNTTLIFLNGDILMSNIWSGEGTNTLVLNTPINEFDKLIIKR